MSDIDELTIIDLSEYGFHHAFLAGHHSPSKAAVVTPHLHPNIFELHVVVQGQIDYLIAGRECVTHAGQALLIQPDMVHETGGAPIVKCERYWLQIRKPRDGASWFELPAEVSHRLVEKLSSIPTQPYVGGNQLVQNFEKLLKSARLDAKDPLTLANMRNLILRIILDFIDLTESSLVSISSSHGVHRAIEMIYGAANTLSLDELSKVSGMSTSTFVHRFREVTGLSPIDFAMRVRIDKARRLLQRLDLSVTDIAMELGFATTQHFATVFRKYMGMSPSDFRKVQKDDGEPVVITDPSMKPLK